MESATEPRNDQPPVMMGVALALSAFVLACAAWALLGYLLAWKLQLSLGIIIPPLAAGCTGGVLMRFARRAFGRRTGWVSVGCVLPGCIVGDLFWIRLATQKPFSVLLGAELTLTLNTMTGLDKLLMYAAACYIAYAISNPPRVYGSA